MLDNRRDQLLSAVISKPKVLLVEPSSTMRQVLQDYAKEVGYEVETHDTYADAANALKQQFDTFDSDFGCLLLGWPPVRDRDSTRLLGMLEGVDYHDLPVVVLSQDMRADSRAWVAARNHSVMLRWKDYRSVRELMENLLDQGINDLAPEVTPKFSNSDIRILVVDDSASIRYALRDLLELHGYDVTVVGSFAEGRVTAQSGQFDIALLDFYLHESTGDDLCRALLDDDKSGELICAILTGTYSDQIIKRSLRAGALECMFKNESSELLLARIDALSRLVRQRSTMVQQREQMDSMLASIGGSVLAFNADGTIIYSNKAANKVLGFTEAIPLTGQSIGTAVSGELQQAAYRKRSMGVFSVNHSHPIDVMYECMDFKKAGASLGTIVVFRTRDEVSDDLVESDKATDKVIGETPDITLEDALQPVMASAPSMHASDATTDPRTQFLVMLSESHRQPRPEGELLTLLMLDVAYVDPGKLLTPIAESATAVELLTDTLEQVYRRESHVAYLGNSKFGILLRHDTESQAYLLTRKIMQIVNEVANEQGNVTQRGEFSCTGALLSLDKNPTLTEAELLRRTRQGLKLIESRGRNNALLIDLKRLLPVYPDQ